MRSSRITPGGRTKTASPRRRIAAQSALAQALLVRGHADFVYVADYQPSCMRSSTTGAIGRRPSARRGARGARAAAVGRDSQLHDLSAGRAALEHDSRRAGPTPCPRV